jgi:hypothetical protein
LFRQLLGCLCGIIRDMPLTSQKSSSWTFASADVLFTAQLCPACALILRTAFSLVLPCTCCKKRLPICSFARVCSVFLCTICYYTQRPPPTLACVHPALISVLLSTLCTCCTRAAACGYLFVVTSDSDFSEASFLQYFRNPGSATSTILMYCQFHCLFCCFAQQCTTAGRCQTSPVSHSPN